MVAPPDPEVLELVVLVPGEADLRARVVDLHPHPEQERFSGQARVTLPWADSRAELTPFAVVVDGEAVGFGILDRTEADLVRLTPRPDRAVLFRSFYLAAEAQGRGWGRAAAGLVPELVRVVHPDATEVVLTVNEANPVALHAYLAAGFLDEGDRDLGGSQGPQHVLRHPLPVRRAT